MTAWVPWVVGLFGVRARVVLRVRVWPKMMPAIRASSVPIMV